MKRKFAVVHPWPGVKNAEYEVIQRLKFAAEAVGIECVLIDNHGRVFEGDPNGFDDRVEFVLALHFFSAKAWDRFTYGVMWNPPAFYFDRNYEESMRNLLSYDDFLTYDSGPIRSHLTNLLSGSGRSFDPTLTLVPGCAGRTLAPIRDAFKKPRLFYCGINWERSAPGKVGRHHHLMKHLDDTGLMRIFGPEVFAGIRPWKGFKSYEGAIPFDGISLLNRINESGLALCLSSDSHRAAEAASNRVYEACSAGALIISDDNPFVVRNFGDCARIFEYTSDPKECFRRVMVEVQWALDHPEAAFEMARASQARYMEKFSLEAQLKTLLDRHPLRAKELQVPSQGAVDVLIPWKGEDSQELGRRLRGVVRQVGVQSRVILVVPPLALQAARQEADAIFGTQGTYEVHELPEWQGPRTTVPRQGELLAWGTRFLKAEHALVVGAGEEIFSDHLARLLQAIRSDGASRFVAYSGYLQPPLTDDLEVGHNEPALAQFDLTGSALQKLLSLSALVPTACVLVRRELLQSFSPASLSALDGLEGQLFLLKGWGRGTAAFSGAATCRATALEWVGSKAMSHQLFLMRDALRFDPTFQARFPHFGVMPPKRREEKISSSGPLDAVRGSIVLFLKRYPRVYPRLRAAYRVLIKTPFG